MTQTSRKEVIQYHQKYLGPGAYELPPILGKKRVVSNLSNTPAFSIGRSARVIAVENDALKIEKSDSKKSPVTPGVGAYFPKFVLPHSPSFVPLRAKRFMEELKNDKKLPISYSQEDRKKELRLGVILFIKIFIKKGQFSKASRFTLKKNQAPGPGDYNIYSHLTLEESLRLKKAQMKADTLDQISHNIPESISKLRALKIMPGPADYNTFKSSLSNKIAKFNSVLLLFKITIGFKI